MPPGRRTVSGRTNEQQQTSATLRSSDSDDHHAAPPAPPRRHPSAVITSYRARGRPRPTVQPRPVSPLELPLQPPVRRSTTTLESRPGTVRPRTSRVSTLIPPEVSVVAAKSSAKASIVLSCRAPSVGTATGSRPSGGCWPGVRTVLAGPRPQHPGPVDGTRWRCPRPAVATRPSTRASGHRGSRETRRGRARRRCVRCAWRRRADRPSGAAGWPASHPPPHTTHRR